MSDNTKIPQLSEDAAEKLLENVFDACDTMPNTIPLKTLESYSEYRREKYLLQKIILIVILAIFLAIPFCFIYPKFTVTKISPDDARIPDYQIVVEKNFPIKLITANVDGRNFTVYETGDRTFSVQPTVNGTMTIRVMLSNRQYDEKVIEVTGIDNDAPYLVSDAKDEDFLYLTVADDGLGIDYEAIYAETLSGHVLKPTSYNKKTGSVVFPIDQGSLNIYIPDVKDNILQLVVTIT